MSLQTSLWNSNLVLVVCTDQVPASSDFIQYKVHGGAINLPTQGTTNLYIAFTSHCVLINLLIFIQVVAQGKLLPGIIIMVQYFAFIVGHVVDYDRLQV